MKFLKWFLIVAGSLLGLLLLISLFLPSKVTVSSSTEIAVSPGQVFHSTASFSDRKEWDPWLNMDPDAAVKISSTDKYIGSTYEWNGDKIGTGKMKVEDVVFPESIHSSIWFGPSPEASEVDWTFEAAGDGTLATWSFTSQGGYPFGRWMLVFMKGMMKPSLENGLAGMKKFLEANPPIMYKLSDIGIDRSYDTEALVYPVEGNMEVISEKIHSGFPMLMAEVEKQDLEINGPAFVHYLDYDPVTDFSHALLAIPVKSKAKVSGDFKPRFYKETEAVVATHIGSYDYFAKSYEAIQKYIEENNIEVSGEAFEVYLTTMMDSENPMEWKTMIAFPLKSGK